ncbi:MAG: SBBP repeat-containing protein, partial [Planctomycetota bacterium]
MHYSFLRFSCIFLILSSSPLSLASGSEGRDGTDHPCLLAHPLNTDSAATQHAALCSTFFGGSGIDGGFCLALDGQGSLYVAGYTGSPDLPTTAGAYQGTFGGGDFDYYIAKFDESLTTLKACTYLGGGNTEGPWGFNLALDADGNVFVAGSTSSIDFPVTPGAFDTLYNGGATDAFVAKLDSDLRSLLAATYLGGAGQDGGDSVCFAVAPEGHVFVSGLTRSNNFPTTPGAFDTTYNGPSGDGFIARLDNNLANLQASTFLGGSGVEFLTAIALDANGNLFASGSTSSSNFPTTSGAYDEVKGFNSDGFVSKLDSGLTTLLASTFFGNDGGENCFLMVIDPKGCVFVAGQIDENSLPVTPGAYDATHNGDWDNYAAKFSN